VVKSRLVGAAGGLCVAVVVVVLGNVDLWIGTDFPFMPPMGRTEAIITLVLFPIIGAAMGGSE
jgi:hypothetical protein